MSLFQEYQETGVPPLTGGILGSLAISMLAGFFWGGFVWFWGEFFGFVGLGFWLVGWFGFDLFVGFFGWLFFVVRLFFVILEMVVSVIPCGFG